MRLLSLQRLIRTGLWLWPALLLACTQPTSTLAPSITPSPARLVWYETPIPSITPVPATPALRATVPPPPSPTPFFHTIIKGDTLGAIAYQYGVTLEEMMIANPGIDPGFLSIDATLVIPIGEENAGAVPTATPVPVITSAPVCYRTAIGGAWCFLLAQNPFDFAVENVWAWMSLYDKGGLNIASLPAVAPLNILPGGQAMPLAAYFEPPLPQSFSVQAEILTALPVAQEETRYLPAEVVLEKVEIAPGERQATAAGWIEIPSPGLPPQEVWLAAVAYGENGEVVGMRKWEAGDSPGESPGDSPCGAWPTPLPSETAAAAPAATVTATTAPAPLVMVECVSFEIEISSLGPPIREVELLVEARP